ncbi:inositol monophosphatase family protein [Paenibacillus sp. NPDC058174]|uniref:inositol monophosphatase family protein n=1 Tax=Paenibacillus sp. NPDC058174 TaxID=3346366 RepID=UPI0036DDF524
MNLDQVLDNIEFWVDKVAAYQKVANEQNQLQVRTKGYATDFVTNADVKSEEMLVECIRSAYPEHSILTEEKGSYTQDSDYLWVIDPIDGTTNFIHRFPFSSISIALQHKGVTLAGMVYSPWLNMKFYATRKGGAYLNGKRIFVSGTARLEKSLLATGFPGGGYSEYMNLEYFNRMISKVAGIRRTGSAALDLCFVAASYFDGFWEFNLHDWDICAGALIVEEAGGIVQRLEVNEHSLILCSNDELYDIFKESLLIQD